MTITDGQVRPHELGPDTWHEVEPGFWVGNDDGAFLGTIEVDGERFFARDSYRRYIGEYRSLTIAFDAVADARV